MCAADRPLPLLVVADAGARLVRRGLVAPGDAARWHGARVAVFRRGPVVCELPAARVDAPSRAPYFPRDSQPARADSVSYPGARRFAPRMTLALYNTLTRRVEPFQPLAPPRVTLYTCGPTVWNYAHLGNFRTFLFEDLLRRYLEASGYDVFHIMNLTDVDDRTIKAARAAGTTLRQHTEPFVRAFFEDRDYLRLRPAHAHPRATESVAAMITLVRRLLDSGVAYQGDDGSVYFAIDRFPGYGRLSRLDRREIKVGARVVSDEYAKDDPRDFALWKKAGPDDDAVGAAAVRLLFWQTHYRKPLDFTDEALAAAGEGVKRIGEFRERLARAGVGGTGDGSGRLAELAAEFEAAFRAALDDDLNAPQAC